MLFQKVWRNFSTLVIAEHNGQNLSKNTLKVLSAATKFSEDTHLLLIGSAANDVVVNSKATVPSTHIQKYITSSLSHGLSDSVQALTQNLINKYNYSRVIGVSTSYGKDVIPRLAGKYDVQPISDIIEVTDNKTFIRPTYAGNALTKVKSQQSIDFLTFRPSAFQQPAEGKNEADSQTIQLDGYEPKTKFVQQQKSGGDKPQLTTARIVVSGGRGVKSKENFSIIYDFADSFGDAAVGASRAAVDSGYCPNEMQVGQTGKVVAPELYFAIGISGAVQHLAGMKDSKYIVAINNRPDEPIFEIADYGLEADLFKVVPELTQKIKKIKAA